MLTELTTEFVRRYSEEMDKDPKSQTIACLLLAMRSASLLCAAGRLLDPRTLDGLEVMKRAFLEARDLLMTFRFNEKGIKDKVEYWFEGKLDNSWNADRKRCEQFLERQNLPGAEFAKPWSSQSALTHPTKYAAQNSAVCVMRWAVPQPQGGCLLPHDESPHRGLSRLHRVPYRFGDRGLAGLNLTRMRPGPDAKHRAISGNGRFLWSCLS